MRTIKTTLVLILLSVVTSYAQKIKVTKGDLGILKGVDKLNVEFDYSDMTVGKKKSEADYIKEKKAAYNKKEAGTGDKWEKAWVADREGRYRPKFEELFNKTSGMTGGKYPDAKYTLIFKTTRTEPGFNIGVTRKDAEIDAEVYIVETANKDAKKVTMSITRIPGRSGGGYDFDTGVRLEEAYAKAGKALGKYIAKKTK